MTRSARPVEWDQVGRSGACENWKLTRLKYLLPRLESGVSVNAADRPANPGNNGVLKTSCVYGDAFKSEENKEVVPEEQDRVACPVTAQSLIISRMNTPELVGSCGFVGQDYPNLFLPDRLWIARFAGRRKCFERYMWYLLISRPVKTMMSLLATGTSGSMKNLSQQDFRGMAVLVPPISEQHAIADFLERETTRIDRLVENYRRLVDLVNEEIASRVFFSMNSSTVREQRLGNVARAISRPVVQRPNELYTPIGLFNRGRGLFHKEPREKDDMGDSDFFWIKEGDLIISGQFAWEGAIVLAGREDSGCVVSHRYHVLRGRDGIALTEYLLALLSTRHGDFLLNENSRGAAGRNRPLNITSLLKEKIPVPDLPAQEMVAKAVHRRIRVLSETAKQIERLEEYRAALISAAVTGQIDVRTYRPQEAAALCQ
jgi:type I restriction enzyme S subunit